MVTNEPNDHLLLTLCLKNSLKGMPNFIMLTLLMGIHY